MLWGKRVSDYIAVQVLMTIFALAIAIIIAIDERRDV